MEDLNKTQLVLLAIFITLVAASSTGVIVVTLMDQAPPAVTQTINRVVERTIETVVSPGKVEKTEIRQVLKEDDTIVASLKKVKQSIVRVIRKAEAGGISQIQKTETIQPSLQDNLSEIFADQVALSSLALLASTGEEGFIVSNDGLVVTSTNILADGDYKYSAFLFDDTEISLDFLKKDTAYGIALFKLVPTEKQKMTLTPLAVLSNSQMSLGQTIIIAGIDSGFNTVSIGFVSAIKQATASTTGAIRTNIKPTEGFSGRPIMDVNGFLLGMYGADNEIAPYSAIKSLIDSIQEKPADKSAVKSVQ